MTVTRGKDFSRDSARHFFLVFERRPQRCRWSNDIGILPGMPSFRNINSGVRRITGWQKGLFPTSLTRTGIRADARFQGRFTNQ